MVGKKKENLRYTMKTKEGQLVTVMARNEAEAIYRLKCEGYGKTYAVRLEVLE